MKWVLHKYLETKKLSSGIISAIFSVCWTEEGGKKCLKGLLVVITKRSCAAGHPGKESSGGFQTWHTFRSRSFQSLSMPVCFIILTHSISHMCVRVCRGGGGRRFWNYPRSFSFRLPPSPALGWDRLKSSIMQRCMDEKRNTEDFLPYYHCQLNYTSLFRHHNRLSVHEKTCIIKCQQRGVGS